MSRPNGDINIGFRMREECDRLFKSCAEAGRALRCDRKNLSSWANGITPDCMHIAKIHYLGGDVIYILTGKRSMKEYGK